MAHIEFHPSDIGNDFACGWSSEKIEHATVFEKIQKAVCKACSLYNTQCVPALPRKMLVEYVIPILNRAGSDYAELPARCPLILGGVFTHEEQWISKEEALKNQDMLI